MRRVAIVGSGISGLCTAFYILKKCAEANIPVELSIFESEPVPGGKMRTIAEDGFLMEWGPNGFLTNKPFSLDLVRDLGIEDRLSKSSDLARKRFIYSGGGMIRLPESPIAFLRSNLMTWPGKIRIGGEFFVSPAPPDLDESLGDFARRRLGSEFLEKILDPMVTGIFAGNADRMSVRAAFPMIHNLEQKYGGLVKGMLALKKERAKEGKKQETTAGPGGVLMSFDNGVQTLIDTLAGKLAEGIHYGSKLVSIQKAADSGYRLFLEEGGIRDAVTADVVVLCTPSYAASQALVTLDPFAADSLSLIPYSPISIIALGYDEKTIGNDLDGFGFLIPRGERRRILGALWDSSIFTNRAPKGMRLIRAMVGGARQPELALLPEKDLVTLVKSEVKATMGITAEPVIARAFVHEKGIPQYLVGHSRILAAAEERLATYPGIHLNSNAYRGVALNDCVRESMEVADRIAKGFASRV